MTFMRNYIVIYLKATLIKTEEGAESYACVVMKWNISNLSHETTEFVTDMQNFLFFFKPSEGI